MQESAIALAAKTIEHFEGFVDHAYRDVVGIPTIGIGHRIRKGDGYDMSSTVTRQEAENMLMDMDLHAVVECIDEKVLQVLNDNQAAALCSLCYNIGVTNFSQSSLLKDLNAGELGEADGQFQRWVHAGDRILQDLVDRRRAEAALFNTPV